MLKFGPSVSSRRTGRCANRRPDSQGPIHIAEQLSMLVGDSAFLIDISLKLGLYWTLATYVDAYVLHGISPQLGHDSMHCYSPLYIFGFRQICTLGRMMAWLAIDASDRHSSIIVPSVSASIARLYNPSRKCRLPSWLRIARNAKAKCTLWRSNTRLQ